MSTFQIVGHVQLDIDGLAPRDGLVNILGNNWPAPPMNCGYVSYVYVAGEDRAVVLAAQYNATFRAEYVRVDRNR